MDEKGGSRGVFPCGGGGVVCVFLCGWVGSCLSDPNDGREKK